MSTNDNVTTTTTTGNDVELQPFPQSFVIVIATALVGQMTVGLVCNLTVLIVYHVAKKHKPGAGLAGGGVAGGIAGSSGGQMTNTISAALITNLNVVDVIICLTAIPLTLTYVLKGRHQRPLFCICQEAAISYASSASALNLLVITFDRYQIIVSPFSRLLKATNLRWMLLVLWGLSLLGLCVPFFALTTSHWQDEEGKGTVYPCFALADSYSSGRRFYFEAYYVLLYFIANIVMIVCYTKIFRTAKTRINTRIALIKAASVHLPTGSTNGYDSTSNAEKNNERTMTKMTMMIVLTFMICWAPHAVTSLATMVVMATYELEMIQLTCVTLAYSATLLHPLLYAFMRRNFREAFMDSFYKRSSGLQGMSVAAGVHFTSNALQGGHTSQNAPQKTPSRGKGSLLNRNKVGALENIEHGVSPQCLTVSTTGEQCVILNEEERTSVVSDKTVVMETREQLRE